jgi:hypothetical protein
MGDRFSIKLKSEEKLDPEIGLNMMTGAVDGVADAVAPRSSKELNSSGVKLKPETGSRMVAGLVDRVDAADETVGAVEASDEKANAIEATVRMSGTILEAITNDKH